MADFGGVLGITKKVFFDPFKTWFFLQLLKRADKWRFQPTNTGVL
jgi:hypothetical protein